MTTYQTELKLRAIRQRQIEDAKTLLAAIEAMKAIRNQTPKRD